jgi:hypothetical protein
VEPSLRECGEHSFSVGTHKDRSYTEKEAYIATPTTMKSKEIVPTVVGNDTMTVVGKDTMIVSLCTTVGCA